MENPGELLGMEGSVSHMIVEIGKPWGISSTSPLLVHMDEGGASWLKGKKMHHLEVPSSTDPHTLLLLVFIS